MDKSGAGESMQRPISPMGAFEGQRVLVTGGAGFVGSSTVTRLLEIGDAVTVLDDFFTGLEDNLPSSGPQLNVIRGSVIEEERVRDLVANADYVFHMAARNIVVSTMNPREDFATNIGGTLNVLMAARNSHVRRVVYTSSASVYGNPRYLPINEDDATNMLSPYSVSKYGGENYCKAFHELDAAVHAIEELKKKRLGEVTVYTPTPRHEIEHAINAGPSPVRPAHE